MNKHVRYKNIFKILSSDDNMMVFYSIMNSSHGVSAEEIMLNNNIAEKELLNCLRTLFKLKLISYKRINNDNIIYYPDLVKINNIFNIFTSNSNLIMNGLQNTSLPMLA